MRHLGFSNAVALLALLVALGGIADAQGATITVNSTADAAADDGECALREAITAANGNAASGATAGECDAGEGLPTVDTIDFSIAGGGPHTIAPASGLPELRESMTIDGGITDPNVVVIDGVNSPSTFGLNLQGTGGHTVRRLAIVNFSFGTVAGTGAPGNTIEQNRIGTNWSGASGRGNGLGIELHGDRNMVRDNVISGNVDAGIDISSTGEENTIVGNRIGTDVAGTSALPNGVGISTFFDTDNVIGGAGAADANLISGNTGAGIRTSSSEGLEVIGNLIGTDITGTAELANGGAGVELGGLSARAVAIGTPGEGNVISGNVASGVEVSASGASVDGNLIGTDATGDAAIPNGISGVLVEAADTRVGSSAQGNVIAGNDVGVLVSSLASTKLTGVVIERNYVGTSADGLSTLPNLDGIRVHGNTEGARIVENVVSGNADDGIEVDADGIRTVSGTVIQGNQVAFASDGTPLGNGDDGINLDDADGTVVGGSLPAEANTLFSNGGAGISVHPDAGATAVLGNRIDENGELGIDLEGGTQDAFGVTENDADDDPFGAGYRQNYPELALALAADESLVLGRLDSKPETDLRIELFASPSADTSGHGEGLRPLGSVEVRTDGAGDASFEATGLEPTAAGEAVSATATALDSAGTALATSEFGRSVTAVECDVIGTAGDDVLTGTAADELICGLGGDDVIAPGGGDDVIIGGDGTDELDLRAASGAVDLDLSAGAGTAGPDDLRGVLGVENVTGSDFADTVTGDDAANVLKGGAGKDTLEGGNGADTLNGQDGADTLRGGAGADTLQGGGGKDTLNGNDGGDTLKGKDGTDALKGGNGADELFGGDGKNDDLDGNDGRDSLNGGAGNGDDCNGGPGNDETAAPGCEKVRSIP